MKPITLLTISLLTLNAAWAEESRTQIDERRIAHPYDQIFTVQAGPFRPKSIAFTNWNKKSFDYGSDTLNTFLSEVGWGIQLFRIGPTSLFVSESIAYTNMTLTVPAGVAPSADNNRVTFNMFGFDTRLSQSLDTLPVANLVPFWELGMQYTLFSQSGTSDLVAGEGSARNWVGALGMRYWLNRSNSLNHDFPGRYIALPVFLSMKVNQIFSNGEGFDPAGTTVLGGVSVGM